MQSHIVIASYDGISTHYCGVGTTVQDTISTLSDLANTKKLKVSLAYISTDPRGKVFDQAALEKSMALVNKTGGKLIPLCNGTAGFTDYDMWQSFPQWEYACASLATALNILLRDDEKNTVMLHDAPFLPFHKFKRQIFGKKITCYYMPRSSGLNHKFGDSDWRKKRIFLENEAFTAIRSDPNSSVLAIGNNFGRHLTQEYGLTFRSDEYLRNGLYFRNFERYLNKQFDTSALQKFGIKVDPNSKILFSWGRASIAKGFKELLQAWHRAADQLPEHVMLIQAPNNSGEDDYFKLLKSYEKYTPRTIIVDDFNPEIWQTALRTKNTDIVCIPSTMDPNPHTPIEAKLFSSGMNYAIISSSADGVKDTFVDQECFWVDPYNIEDFSNQILRAAKQSQNERQSMIQANLTRLSTYDYSKTLRLFLKEKI